MIGMGYMVIVGIVTLVGWLISSRLKSKFKHYSQMRNSSGKSGAEIAVDMLTHYGIRDVKVVQGQGSLTDHYNPKTKTIALSPEVYQGRHVAAAAVSAHECGHAVQHAEAYAMLKTRSALVPVVQFSTKAQQFLFYGMMFGMFAGGGAFGNMLMLALVGTFGATALFSLVTLPVEFDASRRALNWLDDTGNTQGAEYEGAKDALWWAAMTYVASALGALVMFLYFLMRMLGSQR